MTHLIQDSGIDKKPLLGVGMGIPGVIDYKQNHSVLFERIEDGRTLPIGDIIQRYVGKLVYICNDVNLLSWAQKSSPS